MSIPQTEVLKKCIFQPFLSYILTYFVADNNPRSFSDMSEIFMVHPAGPHMCLALFNCKIF